MLGRTELIPVHDGERRMIGPFDCEFIPVTHSVPHAFATAYHTPAGTILHTRRLQARPHAGRRPQDRPRAASARSPSAAAASELLLSDSTNAERPGFTPSESTVGAAHARRCSATTRPAVHRRELRVAPAPRAAGRRGRDRRAAARSRSSAGRWCNNVALAREMGMLDVPVDRVIDIEEVPRYAPGEVCIICTGSQGEPMSALSLMAAHEHKYVKISERRRRRDLRARDPGQRDRT